MAYSFRFYGKAAANWFDDSFPWLEYDVQFERVPTDPEREQIAEIAERTFADGPAATGDDWRWADRFLLFGVGERWPDAGRGMPSRVTDFLMAAKAVCPIEDVVLRNAPGPGDSKWDLWTAGAHPTPDAGPG